MDVDDLVEEQYITAVGHNFHRVTCPDCNIYAGQLNNKFSKLAFSI